MPKKKTVQQKQDLEEEDISSPELKSNKNGKSQSATTKKSSSNTNKSKATKGLEESKIASQSKNNDILKKKNTKNEKDKKKLQEENNVDSPKVKSRTAKKKNLREDSDDDDDNESPKTKPVKKNNKSNNKNSDSDSPKMKSTKKTKKVAQKKKKVDDDSSDDEFRIDDESQDDLDDVEEEKDIKGKLSTKKNEDSDGQYDDYSDNEDLKPKLKKVKNSSSKKGGSRNSSNTKNKKDTGKAPLKNSSKKNSKEGKESPGNDGEPQLPDDDEAFFPINEDGHFDESAYFVPEWIKEENIRDAEGKRPNEEGYNPSTLHISPEELKSCSPMLQQYWTFKREHYDKLVGFKMWKFYHFFYYDAFIVHKLIDSRICKFGKWTYVFFHETSLARNAPKFLSAGHKIVVVEQMDEVKKKDELVRREICQILTRGTAIENSEIDYASRFLLCIFEDSLQYGIVLCDTTTHEFHIGEFDDDTNRSNLRTLLTRTKPLEVICMKNFIETDTINMIKALSSKPTLSFISKNEVRSFETIFDTLKNYFTPSDSEETEYPEILRQMKESFEIEVKTKKNKNNSQGEQQENKLPFYSTLQALAMCVEYLESILLAETVVSMGTFSPFDLTVEKKSTLYLDSQALLNLEILDVQYYNLLSESHSLFGYMDKTVTAFGKRMLKRWITSPLIDAGAIAERQEAIEDLMNDMDVAEYFSKELSKLPDLERMINKIYNLSNKQRLSAVYFEDFAKNRLKDFLAFLKELKKVENLVETFTDYVPNFQSKRLIQLTTFKEVDLDAFKKRKKVSTKKTKTTGVFPRINTILSDLEGMVELRDGLPIPKIGVNQDIDDMIEKITDIKSSLQDHLERQRKKFSCNEIKYTHTKHRYELEIPEDLVEGTKRPKEFAITSKRKGFLRFHTPEIEACLRKLWHYEYDFQKLFTPFVSDYFKKFYERNNYWQQVISCLGELDCLCSLAKLAATMNEKCKPEVLPLSDEIVFQLEGMVHPMAAKSNPNFVPNDIVVEESVDTFLITGPNMGGKSTLLRQACLAVIMAQVGSFVPATSFKLSAVDRIFTRVGASDRILEGKSTFFIEMEETYNIVTEATKNSLLILDELGRGTSTYDGVSIAYGTLKYIVENIECITLFATHYHLLIDEFKLYKNIETYSMQCKFDEEKDEIKFLYKFGKGQAAKSHGVVIAKIAGLPLDVIAAAKEKANFMTKEKRNIGFEKNLLERFNNTIDELAKIDEGKSFNPDKVLQELSQFH